MGLKNTARRCWYRWTSWALSFAIILAMMAALFIFSPVFHEILSSELLFPPISSAVAFVPEGSCRRLSPLSSRCVQASGAQAGDYPQAANG